MEGDSKRETSGFHWIRVWTIQFLVRTIMESTFRSDLWCVNLPTQAEIRLIRRNFTWSILFFRVKREAPVLIDTKRENETVNISLCWFLPLVERLSVNHFSCLWQINKAKVAIIPYELAVYFGINLRSFCHTVCRFQICSDEPNVEFARAQVASQ